MMFRNALETEWPNGYNSFIGIDKPLVQPFCFESFLLWSPSVYLSVSVSVYLSVCLSVCLSISVSVGLITISTVATGVGLSSLTHSLTHSLAQFVSLSPWLTRRKKSSSFLLLSLSFRPASVSVCLSVCLADRRKKVQENRIFHGKTTCDIAPFSRSYKTRTLEVILASV